MSRTLFLIFLFLSHSLFAQVNLNQGLVAYYPFNGNANDASGNNNNPVFNNATLTADRFGNSNSAYLFNGIDNYMQIPSSPSLNPSNQISICAWVKVNGFYQGVCHGNSIVMKGDGDYQTGNYALRFDDNPFTNGQNCSTSVVDINHENFYGVNLMATPPGYTPYIQTGAWFSVIYTCDGITAKLYVNCQLKISAPANTLTFSNSYDLFLGKMNNATFPYWFNGVMDEVRIYNRALNQDEIDSLSSDGSSVSLTTHNIALCKGDSVQLNASGSQNYIWSPTNGLSNPNISDPIALPFSTTNYIVTGIAQNGCPLKDSVLISVNPKPVITKSNDTLICKNAATLLFASGGTTYSWSPPASLNDPNSSNPVATPSATTEYYVTVTDANTCTNIDSVLVNVRPDPIFTVSPATNVCEKNSIQLTATGGDVYSWQPATTLNNPDISNPIADPTTTTDYSVQITETTCNNTTTLTTTVTVLPLPTVQASKSNDLDCSNDASQLKATGATIYIWSPAETLNNPNIQNPIARPTTNTLYSVKGVDASGCSNVDTITVYVTGLNKDGYLMPNAFTPNNDGKNDCYGIKYWGVIQELDFSIYNRWGQRIFHTNQPGQCWDGTFNGQPQNPDVYIYMIKAKTFCDQSIFRKGTFTLIR